MQYLTKAYSYYSGINPATLSGAIDVIVIRHVDDDGNVILSSTPFHVRFGKLQVLRAGEKRVILRLPNNLPPPHMAPFSMKVGETGEAFFVIETDEEVPEDLLTSPVVMPSDARQPGALPPSPPHSEQNLLPPTQYSEPPGISQPSQPGHSNPQRTTIGASLTQQPFGETEEQVHHAQIAKDVTDAMQEASKPLGEVEFLDLNAEPARHSLKALEHSLREDLENSTDNPVNEPRDSTAGSNSSVSAVSPSSLLSSATAMLPSIPFLSTPSSSQSASPEKSPRPRSSSPPRETWSSQAKESASPHAASSIPVPPNPMIAQAGESAELPLRDDTLSSYSKSHGTDQEQQVTPGSSDVLPKVKAADGEGPEVLYGKNVVLDMAGYHSTDADPEHHHDEHHIPAAEKVMGDRAPSRQTEPEGSVVTVDQGLVKATLLDTFVADLEISTTLPPPSLSRPLRPGLPATRVTDSTVPRANPMSKKANHAADPTLGSSSSLEMPPAVASLMLESSHPDSDTSPSDRRFDRGQSEPPMSAETGDIDQITLSPPVQQGLRRPDTPMSRLPNDSKFPPSTRMPSSRVQPNPTTEYAWDWGQMPHDSTMKLQTVPRRSSDMERSPSGPPSSAVEVTEIQALDDSVPPTGQSLVTQQAEPGDHLPGKLKNIEDSPFTFVLDMEAGRSHTFELALCEGQDFATQCEASPNEETIFLKSRVSFQTFVEDPQIVDDPRLVIRYSMLYLTWTTGYPLLCALAMYRRSLTPPHLPMSDMLPPLIDLGIDSTVPPRPPSGYGWSRWWRRGQSGIVTPSASSAERRQSIQGILHEKDDAEPIPSPPLSTSTSGAIVGKSPAPEKQYAKTLRLSSEQLKELNLKPGPNTIQFSVTSSYSGFATCAARIFLWDGSDQIVISDIDGTITKSDALGHVFAAIGRDWTHGGIAKLYTDICNNGYKMMYLTSRAIGQADSTREYLRSIIQGDYRLPEGPVIMSPDRLMASLHREVIMRKPELFKMACLRDIQRLFAKNAKEAFFAGFGNRITDAMSYRSVGIETSKIYTIDSTGVVRTELLQAAGHKGSYMGLNDLVNEVFPPASTKVKPEYGDFNYWRPPIVDIAMPDLTPPSPALSARSDTSSRLGVGMLGKIASIGRRSSKQPVLPVSNDPSSRPSSPLVGPAITADEMSETGDTEDSGRRSRTSSMPGSFEEKGGYMPNSTSWRAREEQERDMEEGRGRWNKTMDGEEERQEKAFFDDDILAEMKNVPF